MAGKLVWVERLAKWKTIFTGWQLGTRPIGDPESDALRDINEQRLILRAEMTALTALLIRNKVFTIEEFREQLEIESRELCRMLEKRFPGVRATDEGIQIDKRALAWMKDWKP